MHRWHRSVALTLTVGFVVLAVGCTEQPTLTDPTEANAELKNGPPDGRGGGNGGRPGGESAGNNLSYPVIWAEGVVKTLPGTLGMDPILTGEWWYQWGTNGIDPDVTPASCPPDPDDTGYCDDGVEGTTGPEPGTIPADDPLPLARVYLQKDAGNVWQAWSGDVAASGEGEADGTLVVDSIDWGDNLESVDWYTKSQVRTELVLFQTLTVPQVEYLMRHTSGWGIDEVHGVAASLTDPPLAESVLGTRATVYTHCARLTIQKLMVPRDHADLDPTLGNLVWVPMLGWTESETYTGELINAPFFNRPVYEGGDGPGYYSAEINVKGRIIYGYTWNVRKDNDMTPVPPEIVPTAAGDYRITFSLDQACGAAVLNTFFVDGVTGIMVPAEEEIIVAAEEGDTGGAVGVLDYASNLTYMDVRILERGGGGGGGNKP